MTQVPEPHQLEHRQLQAARPDDVPRPSVRARHRAELEYAILRSDRRTPTSRRVTAVAAGLVVLGAAVGAALAMDDRPTTQAVASGDGAAGNPSGPTSSSTEATPASAACGGDPLPFRVPVGEGFGSGVDGPAPGAPGPDVDGQLVKHWTSGATSLEVRWPAASYVDADVTIERMVSADGSVHVAPTSWRTDPDFAGIFAFAVVGRESDAATWGAGMCAAVQLTVRSTELAGDVRADAEVLYRDLLAAGGPLAPMSSTEPLVAHRVEADALEPATRCDAAPGQRAVRSEGVDGGAPHPTPDDALAAYLDSQVVTEPGPFGPVTNDSLPGAGYTAVSLPDGRVAFELPDPPAPDRPLVGYIVTEPVAGGWSVTSVELPSC